MVTVRTIKLKRSSQAYGDSAGSANLSTPAASEDSAATAYAPGQPADQATPPPPATVVPVVTQKTVSDKSTVWFALTAIVAVIGLIVIIGLQYSEMSFYKEAPSVWLPGK